MARKLTIHYEFFNNSSPVCCVMPFPLVSMVSIVVPRYPWVSMGMPWYVNLLDQLADVHQLRRFWGN